jgi:DNA-binding NarL/FixJ family response regulator
MPLDSIALRPMLTAPTAHPVDEAFRPQLRLVSPLPLDPVTVLTRRERQVLGLMSEGRSNNSICGELFISPKTLERHVQHIFAKLELPPSADQHRRVRAVLTWLRSPLSEQAGG